MHEHPELLRSCPSLVVREGRVVANLSHSQIRDVMIPGVIQLNVGQSNVPINSATYYVAAISRNNR